MPNWLGDLVMATPILADLRRQWPQARITAMCQKNVAPLLKEDPNLDEVLCFKRPSRWVHRKQHLEIIETVRRGEYDLGVLLTNSLSSAWWFYRGGVKRRVGFKAYWRSPLLTDAVPFPEDKETQHLVDTYKELLVPLGIPHSETAPELYLTDGERTAARLLLSRHGVERGSHTLIGINPGAAYGSAKCWLPERFRELTERLLEDPNVHVVYFGDQAGAPLVNKICSGLDDRVINLAGRTPLRELIALIAACHVLLTNDSGPMHIAAAVRTPVVALFGSTNAIKTGPYPEGRVLQKDVACAPCYKRTCPIDFRCMKRIGVDEVYDKLQTALREHAPLQPR